MYNYSGMPLNGAFNTINSPINYQNIYAAGNFTFRTPLTVNENDGIDVPKENISKEKKTSKRNSSKNVNQILKATKDDKDSKKKENKSDDTQLSLWGE